MARQAPKQVAMQPRRPVGGINQTIDEPVHAATFFPHRSRRRWWVASTYEDEALRHVVGPFWFRISANRVARAMTTHFRNGRAIGHAAGLRCANLGLKGITDQHLVDTVTGARDLLCELTPLMGYLPPHHRTSLTNRVKRYHDFLSEIARAIGARS